MNAEREGKKKPREGRIQNHFCVILYYIIILLFLKKKNSVVLIF